jgi:hypothetical protein
MATFNLIATVMVVAYVQGGMLFCNSPHGYIVKAVSQDGASVRILEESSQAASKAFDPPLLPGEAMIIEPMP